MKVSTVRKLNALNHAFYEDFGREFSRSRMVLQPGILRALSLLGSFESFLDLGCGDGRVGRALLHGQLPGRSSGWRGRYVGIDFSGALLQSVPAGGSGSRLRMIRADITDPTWVKRAGLQESSFDAAVLFSLLHHIPSHELRLEVLETLRFLLKEGAVCAISVWQLLHLERFRRKIAAWSALGMNPSDVEPGDLLVDWRRGGHGLRYIHHFAREELVRLCAQGGLQVWEEYRSDGQTGDLGLYVLVRKAG